MDFLPEIDTEMHLKRAKMMQEREEMGDFYPESTPNVRILSQDEVHGARLDALYAYREKLVGKMGSSSSSPLKTILDKVESEIDALESGGSE